MNFNIFGLVESWLKPLDYFHKDDYNLEFANRLQNTRGGGSVCLFIKDGLKYFIKEDLSQVKHPLNAETLFVEIGRPRFLNIIVGIMYGVRILLSSTILQKLSYLRLLKNKLNSLT